MYARFQTKTTQNPYPMGQHIPVWHGLFKGVASPTWGSSRPCQFFAHASNPVALLFKTLMKLLSCQTSIINSKIDCGTVGALVVYPLNIHFSVTAGAQDCGTTRFTHLDFSICRLPDCGTAGPAQYIEHKCETAGAVFSSEIFSGLGILLNLE